MACRLDRSSGTGALAAVTDARKFREQGVLRSLWRVAVILTCVQLRRPIPASALRFFRDVR